MSKFSIHKSAPPSHRAIPDGTTYDLAAHIGTEVVLATIEGTHIKLDLKSATTSRTDWIENAHADITHMDLTRKHVRVTCQRYFTIWDNIDPRRRGLRWKMVCLKTNEHSVSGEFIIDMAIFDR